MLIERGGGGQLSRTVYCRRWRSLAERRGIEPLRRCRRPWLSRPAPYRLGQRSVVRKRIAPLPSCEDFRPSLVRFTGGSGGAERNRTPDVLRAKQALFQLSYNPIMPARFQAHEVLLPLAAAPAHPSEYAALLSVVSQLLSVCVPSGFHGWERPSIPVLAHINGNWLQRSDSNRRATAYEAVLVPSPATLPYRGVFSRNYSPKFPPKLRTSYDMRDRLGGGRQSERRYSMSTYVVL